MMNNIISYQEGMIKNICDKTWFITIATCVLYKYQTHSLALCVVRCCSVIQHTLTISCSCGFIFHPPFKFKHSPNTSMHFINMLVPDILFHILHSSVNVKLCCCAFPDPGPRSHQSSGVTVAPAPSKRSYTICF